MVELPLKTFLLPCVGHALRGRLDPKGFHEFEGYSCKGIGSKAKEGPKEQAFPSIRSCVWMVDGCMQMVEGPWIDKKNKKIYVDMLSNETKKTLESLCILKTLDV
jgi:hypothetical protein